MVCLAATMAEAVAGAPYAWAVYMIPTDTGRMQAGRHGRGFRNFREKC